jgi:hypothetical protein
VDGAREATPAELNFHRRATAALVAALVPAPQGVTSTQDDFKNLPGIGALCKGQKEGDFIVEASGSYVLKLSEDEFIRRRAERIAISDQIEALRLLPPEQKAQREALQQKASAGYDATDAARKAGDQATAKARETEAHALSQQAEDIQRRHEESVRPQVQELRKRSDSIDLEGQKADMRLAINVTRLPGANLTIPFGAYGAASPGKSAGLKVNNVVWSVNGTDTPLRKTLVDAVDKARLQGLVGKPLPPESESEAYAIKAASAAPVATTSAAAQPAAATANPNPATAAASKPAQKNAAAPPVSPPATPPAVEPVKAAKDAVNTLRGLLGR